MPAKGANSQAGGTDGVAERVLAVRPMGSGLQFEMQWRGQQQTTWEPASRMRMRHPQLVQEFEQQQQQKEGAPASDGAAPADSAEQSGGEQPAESAAAATQKRLDEMSRLIEQQAQRAEEQQKRAREQDALIAQLRASSANSLPRSAQPSPQLSPRQEPRRNAVAAATAPAAESVSRFAKKEPRAQDLREYDGAPGAKLDAWLKELARAADLYELSARETVKFGVSRLQDAALDWWLNLGASGKADVSDSGALAAALRKRFQPITAATVAREQLDRLQQGSRHINDYIADFQRLRAQLSDMGSADALHAFVRGLRRDIAVELRKQRVQAVDEAIELAAHIGSFAVAASAQQSRGAAANQMDIDEGDGSSGRLDRIEAALNALTAGGRGNVGMGAKTPTQHGYQQEQAQRGGRGGRGGFRGGRFGQRPLPVVPGVPEEAVRERIRAQQCLRCGREGHTSHACPNAISASGN
jgi:hypothetical protein